MSTTEADICTAGNPDEQIVSRVSVVINRSCFDECGLEEFEGRLKGIVKNLVQNKHCMEVTNTEKNVKVNGCYCGIKDIRQELEKILRQPIKSLKGDTVKKRKEKDTTSERDFEETETKGHSDEMNTAQLCYKPKKSHHIPIDEDFYCFLSCHDEIETIKKLCSSVNECRIESGFAIELELLSDDEQNINLLEDAVATARNRFAVEEFQIPQEICHMDLLNLTKQTGKSDGVMTFFDHEKRLVKIIGSPEKVSKRKERLERALAEEPDFTVMDIEGKRKTSDTIPIHSDGRGKSEVTVAQENPTQVTPSAEGCSTEEHVVNKKKEIHEIANRQDIRKVDTKVTELKEVGKDVVTNETALNEGSIEVATKETELEEGSRKVDIKETEDDESYATEDGLDMEKKVKPVANADLKNLTEQGTGKLPSEELDMKKKNEEKTCKTHEKNPELDNETEQGFNKVLTREVTLGYKNEQEFSKDVALGNPLGNVAGDAHLNNLRREYENEQDDNFARCTNVDRDVDRDGNRDGDQDVDRDDDRVVGREVDRDGDRYVDPDVDLNVDRDADRNVDLEPRNKTSNKSISQLTLNETVLQQKTEQEIGKKMVLTINLEQTERHHKSETEYDKTAVKNDDEDNDDGDDDERRKTNDEPLLKQDDDKNVITDVTETNESKSSIKSSEAHRDEPGLREANAFVAVKPDSGREDKHFVDGIHGMHSMHGREGVSCGKKDKVIAKKKKVPTATLR